MVNADSPVATDCNAHAPCDAPDAHHVVGRASGVVITPIYDFDKHDTTIEIHGLKDGARVVVSVPGTDDEQTLIIGKRGKVHAFGFGANSGVGPVQIGQR